jgi:uncharacterized protein YegJ (DUF2314 family)
MRNVAWIVVLALGGACKEKERETAVGVRTASPAAGSATANIAHGVPARRGTLRREEFVHLGVIAPPDADTKTLVDIAKRVGDVVAEPSTPAEVGWNREHAEWYGKDVPAADTATIARSTYALAIVAKGPGARRRAGDAAIAAAKACRGWIVDGHAHHLYTTDTLASHLPGSGPLDVRKLIVVHQVAGEHALTFLDTAGMSELGFPELFVADVPPSHAGDITSVVNATAQTLIERGDLTRDGEIDVDARKLTGDWHVDELTKAGGNAKITWTVTWSRGDADPKEKLDPDQLELQLSLKGAKPGSAEVLLAAVEAYQGATEDKVTYVDYNDELAAAGVKAREALTKLRPRFAKGMAPGEELAVKAPFDTDDGNIEWMWIDVVSFKGEVLDGTLDNDPDKIRALKIGARVKVKLGKVADFIHRTPDGTKTGGYSLEVFRAHGEDVPPL